MIGYGALRFGGRLSPFGAALLGAAVAALLSVTVPTAAAEDRPTSAPHGPFEPDAFRIWLARRFAPELRFNAYVPDGAASNSNRNEDFFPGDVSAFWRMLESGTYPIVTALSEGVKPGRIEQVQFPPTARFENGRVVGYPERIAGEPPGRAPTYVHVYRTADAGGGERGAPTEHWFCEYWQWYPYDYACSHVLGRFGCLGGHRGDWEHQCFEIEVERISGAREPLAKLLRGVYYGHGRAIAVSGDRLERVDDEGNETSKGTHPVVYVALGKHASYPYAGELHDFVVHRALADHDDFFRGNGVRIAAWRTPLVDISPSVLDLGAKRFAPPAFRAVLARNPSVRLSNWLAFQGRWGPDDVRVLDIPIARSPTGPYAKHSFGNQGREAIEFERWRAPLGDKLRLYRESGREVPRVVPPPVPVRR